MKKFRIVAILLVMCLASSCFVGSTFAKYSSSGTMTDSAVIAKWSIKVDSDEIAVANPQPFTVDVDLFTTVEDTDPNDAEADDHVKQANGAGTPVIAPGTKGSAGILIENNSDVTAHFVIGDLAANIDLPSGFDLSIDQQDFTLAANETKTITLSWEWPFEETPDSSSYDVNHTGFGIGSQITRTVITVTASVTATQVN